MWTGVIHFPSLNFSTRPSLDKSYGSKHAQTRGGIKKRAVRLVCPLPGQTTQYENVKKLYLYYLNYGRCYAKIIIIYVIYYHNFVYYLCIIFIIFIMYHYLKLCFKGGVCLGQINNKIILDIVDMLLCYRIQQLVHRFPPITTVQ